MTGHMMSDPPRTRTTTPVTEPPDLLARLRAGTPGAFDDLVRLTQDRVYAVALRMMGKPEDALDAVQDAYLSAFKALDRFEGGSSLSTWLHRITMNACLMKMRSRRRRPQALIDDLMPTFLADGHQARPSRPWKPAGEGGIERRECVALAREAIDRLPDHLREVMLLRDIEGIDTQTCAEMLDVSVAVVKNRLHRARMAVRAVLEPHFLEDQP
jgi:RNA polymerase sigma-70 factor (ECF subfamily)